MDNIVVGAPGIFLLRKKALEIPHINESALVAALIGTSRIICKSELGYEHHRLGDKSKIRG